MPFIWQQIYNVKDNRNKELVLAGWDPGEGRTLPPMSHEEFKKAWLAWIKSGAYAPAL